MTDSIILEEEIDPNYEPTEDEVQEYAKWLGMDTEVDGDFLWIAREGLKAPLPEHWKPCKTTDTDEIYYFNFSTGESTWDHPCDGFYRQYYEDAKKKKMNKFGGFGTKQNSKEERKRKQKEKKEILEIVGKQRHQTPDKEDVEQLRRLRKNTSSSNKDKNGRNVSGPLSISIDQSEISGRGLNLKPLPGIGASPLSATEKRSLNPVLDHPSEIKSKPLDIYNSAGFEKIKRNDSDFFSHREKGVSGGSYNMPQQMEDIESKDYISERSTKRMSSSLNTVRNQAYVSDNILSANEEHEHKLEWLRKQHLKDQESLKQDFEEEIEQLQRRHERQLDKAREEHAQIIQSERKRLEKDRLYEIEKIKDSNNYEKQELGEMFQREKQKMITHFETEKETLKGKIEAERAVILEELEQKKSMSIDEAYRKLEVYEKEKKNFEKENRKLQNEKKSIENSKKELEKESIRLEKESKRLQEEILDIRKQTSILNRREETVTREETKVEKDRNALKVKERRLNDEDARIREMKGSFNEEKEKHDKEKEKIESLKHDMEYEEKISSIEIQDSSAQKILALEMRLREAEEKLITSQEKLVSSETKRDQGSNCASFKAEIEKAKAELNDCHEKYQLKIERLKSEAASELKEKQLQLESEIENFKEKEKHLGEEIILLQQRAELSKILEEKVEELDGECKKLKNSEESLHKKLDDELKLYKLEKEKMTKDIDAKKQEIEHLSHDLSQLKKQLTESERSLLDDLQQKLQTEKNCRKEEVEALEIKLKEAGKILDEKTSEVKELQQQVVSGEISLDILETKLKSAEIDLKSREEDLVMQKVQHASLTGELKKSHSQAESYEYELDACNFKINENEKVIHRKQLQIDELLQNQKKMEQILKEKTKNLNISEEKVSSDAVTILNLTSEITKCKIDISELTRKLDAARECINTQKEEANTRNIEKNTESPKQYHREDTDNEETKELMKQIDVYIEKISELEHERSLEHDKRISAEEKVSMFEAMQKELDSQKAKHDETLKDLESLKAHKRGWEERVSSLKVERDESYRENDNLKQQLINIAEDEKNAKENAENSRNQILILQKKYDTKENELNEYKNTISQLQSTEAKLTDQIHKLDIRLSQSHSDYARLEEQENENQTLISNLRGKVISSERQLKLLEDSMVRANEENRSKEKTALVEELNTIQTKLRTLQSGKEKDIKDLECKLQAERRNVDEMNHRIHLQNREKDELDSKLQALRSLTQSQIEDLKSKLQVERRHVDEMSHKLRMINREKNDLEAKLENLEEKHLVAKEELRKLKLTSNLKETESLTDSLNSSSVNLQQIQLNAKIELLQSENDRIRTQVMLVKTDRDQALGDSTALRGRLKDARREQECLVDDIASLRTRLNCSKTELDSVKKKVTLLEGSLSEAKMTIKNQLQEIETLRKEKSLSNNSNLDNTESMNNLIEMRLEEVSQAFTYLKEKIETKDAHDIVKQNQDRLRHIEKDLEQLRCGHTLSEVAEKVYDQADCVHIPEVDASLKRALGEEVLLKSAADFILQQKKSILKRKKRLESEQNQWKHFAKSPSHAYDKVDHSKSQHIIMKQMKNAFESQISQMNNEISQIKMTEKWVQKRADNIKELKATAKYAVEGKNEARVTEALKHLDDLQYKLDKESISDEESKIDGFGCVYSSDVACEDEKEADESSHDHQFFPNPYMNENHYFGQPYPNFHPQLTFYPTSQLMNAPSGVIFREGNFMNSGHLSAPGFLDSNYPRKPLRERSNVSNWLLEFSRNIGRQEISLAPRKLPKKYRVKHKRRSKTSL